MSAGRVFSPRPRRVGLLFSVFRPGGYHFTMMVRARMVMRISGRPFPGHGVFFFFFLTFRSVAYRGEDCVEGSCVAFRAPISVFQRGAACRADFRHGSRLRSVMGLRGWGEIGSLWCGPIPYATIPSKSSIFSLLAPPLCLYSHMMMAAFLFALISMPRCSRPSSTLRMISASLQSSCGPARASSGLPSRMRRPRSSSSSMV